MKKKTYGQLKKELDRVFSIYVRTRNLDAHGMATCVTCGVKKPWREMQCGHFIKRSHLATRWMPKNNHVQCQQCNVFKGGNYPSYAKFLIDSYGPKIIDVLVEWSKVVTKYSRHDLEKLIASYRNACNESPIRDRSPRRRKPSRLTDSAEHP